MTNREIAADYLLAKLTDSEINSLGEMLKAKDSKTFGNNVYSKGMVHTITIHFSGYGGSVIIPDFPNSPYIQR